ncbi:hypothetical protein ACWD6P_09105 [Streptomyces sp. NPDC002446]
MTIDQNLVEDMTGPATLQMPQQAPPILRNAAASAGALGVTAGVGANFDFDFFGSLGGTVDQMIGSSLSQLVGAIPDLSQWF